MIETRLFAEKPILLNCDNLSAISLSENAKFSGTTKHLIAKYAAIKELVDAKQLKVEHVSTKDMLAESLTKPVDGPKLREFRKTINLQD